MGSTKQARGRPRSEAVDAAITKAALEEFLDRGAANTGIEQVAARASIYRRFPNQAQLLVAAIEALHADAPLGWQSVQALIADWARYLSDRRQRRLLRRLFAATDDLPALRRVYWRVAGRQRAAAVLETLRRAVRQGQFPRGTDARVVASALSGATLVELGARDRRRAADIEGQLLELLKHLGFRRGPTT
jgi:AcrR family transcriptional regulator